MCFSPSDAEFKFDKLSGSAQRGGHFSLPPQIYCIFFSSFFFFSSPLQLQSRFRIRKRLMMIIVVAAACHLRQPVSKRAGELARLFIPHLHTFCLFTQRHRAHTEMQLEASSSFIHLFIYFPIQATHLQIWYEFSKMSAGTSSKALALALASVMLLHTWRQNVKYISIKRAQLLLRLPRSSLICQWRK